MPERCDVTESAETELEQLRAQNAELLITPLCGFTQYHALGAAAPAGNSFSERGDP